jgi:hypothetical protein
MPNIHELLDETKSKADGLAKEIESLRSARIVSQELNDALQNTCKALEITTKNIRPFTDQRIRRMQIFILGFFILNLAMFGTILFFILRN